MPQLSVNFYKTPGRAVYFDDKRRSKWACTRFFIYDGVGRGYGFSVCSLQSSFLAGAHCVLLVDIGKRS